MKSLSDPLRVCFDGRFVADHYPGVGRYAFELARAMASIERLELEVLHDPTVTSSRFDLESLAGDMTTLVEVRFGPRSLANQIKGPVVIRRCRVDLFHSPFIVVPYRRVGPRVVTVHDLLPVQWPRSVLAPLARPLFPLLLRQVVRSADLILVPSESTAAALSSWLRSSHRLLPTLRRRIRTVPYAVRGEVFHRRSPEEVARLRTRLDLPERYVLCFGSRRPHKNLGTLLSAWEGVERQTRADARLVIAGADGRLGRGQTDLGGAVQRLGEIEEALLPVLYSGAEVFVTPSRSEGFGLPVLEAMACGTPVVCSRGGALSEVAGDAAELFSPLDVHELAACLSAVLRSPERREQLAAAGLRRASKFSWRRTARDTVAAYDEVLGR